MEKVEKDAGKKKKRRSKGEGSIYFDGKNPDSIKTRIETLQMLIISSSSRLSKNPDSIKTRIETCISSIHMCNDFCVRTLIPLKQG